MKAKDYLLRIKQLDQKIENKQMEIDSLYELLKSVTIKPKEVDVQTSMNGDKMADTISKIVDMKDELNADIDKYVDAKMEAIKLINELDNPEQANILIRRYINSETLEEIADSLGFTRQAINYQHGKALLEFQQILTRFYKFCVVLPSEE